MSRKCQEECKKNAIFYRLYRAVALMVIERWVTIRDISGMFKGKFPGHSEVTIRDKSLHILKDKRYKRKRKDIKKNTLSSVKKRAHFKNVEELLRYVLKHIRKWQIYFVNPIVFANLQPITKN